MRTRPARTEDLARISEIRAGVRENRLTDPSRVTEAEVRWYLEEAIFLVSEGDADGEIQGFGCADHQTGFIWALFVHRDAEGCGHGGALLRAMLERLRTLGHRQSFLTTDAATRAYAFYLRRGFTDMGRTFRGETALVRHLDGRGGESGQPLAHPFPP